MTRLPPPLSPAEQALFLDFDGVLVEIVDDPARVAVGPSILSRLIDLRAELGGSLAVVSGRRIADLDRFLSPLRFAAAGVHGLERRSDPDGEVVVLASKDSMAAIHERLVEMVRRQPRIKLEDKGTALVLHYRTAPDLEAFADDAMRQAVGDRDDMVVMKGKAIVEVHPAGMNKGRAVADLMATTPFAGRRPVYIGDDTTDEFALAFVREAGGIAIKVGTAPSVADHRLEDVAAVHRWLGA